jgi:hypothetical protein
VPVFIAWAGVIIRAGTRPAPTRAIKNNQHHAQTIDRRHKGGDQPHQIEPAVKCPTLEPDRREDAILAEETAGQRQPGQTERPGRKARRSPAGKTVRHAEDILFMMQGGNGSRRRKRRALKKAWMRRWKVAAVTPGADRSIM